MRISLKLLLISLVFIMNVLYVNAAEPYDCNTAGGIWCDSPGYCVQKNIYYSGECIVTSNQRVERGQGLTQIQYIIDKLKISSIGKLNFLSTLGTPQGGGGGGGGGGKGEDDCCGQNAVSGGAGGGMFKSGFAGENGNSGNPGFFGRPGANILLTLNELNSEGLISVSGEDAGAGVCLAYRCDGGSSGCGGDGGGGGGGAGQLSLHINNQMTLNSNAKFYARGGSGGTGACGTSDCGACCSDGSGCNDEDGGGGGGGGGAGAGGRIYFETPDTNKKTTFENMLTSSGSEILCDAGGVGAGGGGGLDEGQTGGSGGSASSGTCPLTFTVAAGKTEIDGYTGVIGKDACFDNVDNDLDGYTDFEDFDCFSAPNFGWTTIGTPLTSMVSPGLKKSDPSAPTWWLPSATTGFDAVCGDDGTSSCTGTPVVNCNVGITQCASTPGCKAESGTYISYGDYNCDTGIETFPACNSGDTQSNPLTQIAYCCSDNQIGCCMPNDPSCFGLPVYTQHDYTSQVTCSHEACVKDPAYSCLGRTTQPTCTAITGCYWINGLSFAYDYASVVNNYLCYNNISDLRRGGVPPQWEWKDANKDPFKILTVKKSPSDKTIDVISNSQQWYYCDANSALTTPPKPGGTAILEYGTFTVPSGSSDMVECYIALTSIYQSAGMSGVVFSNGPPGTYYCDKSPAGPAMGHRDNLYECATKCYNNNIPIQNDFCTLFPQYCAGLGLGFSGTSSTLVDKRFCYFDLSGCMNKTLFDPTKKCSAQAVNAPEYTHEKCDPPDKVCKNGLILRTDNNQENCCFGIGAECIDKPSSYQDCKDRGGIEDFDVNAFSCFPASAAINDGSGKYCCLGLLLPKTTGYFSYQDPNAFMCFKNNGSNMVSECGYDINAMQNGELALGADISYSSLRLHSQGSVINRIRNFDAPDSSGIIVDWSQKVSIVDGYPITIDPVLGSITSLNSYEYLEFDVAYSSKDFQMYLMDNTKKSIIDKEKYSGNNVEPMRWHHIIIPLSDFNEIKIFDGIYFKTTNPTPIVILVDNIVLTPPENSPLHSQNWYCAGGFGRWIPELDPNLTTHPFSDTTYFNNWNSYGPYQFGCEVQGPFGWTRHQCCGDDSRPTTGGTYVYEYFNDTEGACFEGSYMADGMSVWYTKGYEEGTETFEEYRYKDLLYRDDKFIGCQVSNGKYSDLDIIYDPKKSSYPNTNQGQDLYSPANTVKSACAINGTYYCFDQAWRRIVPGIEWKNEDLFLKSAPPGATLIENGNFGSDDRKCVNPPC